MFAVTPKEKFRVRIMFNPSEKILDFDLIYCGGYDIRCSVGINMLNDVNSTTEKTRREIIFNGVKDKFMAVSRRLGNFKMSTVGEMTFNLTIKVEIIC